MVSTLDLFDSLLLFKEFALIENLDKKNENKSVAVNDFMPAADAVKAIQYSM